MVPKNKKENIMGTFLVVQWLRLWISNAETRFHMLQQRPCTDKQNKHLTKINMFWKGIVVKKWQSSMMVSLSLTISQSLLKLMSTESVMLSNHLILCYFLLLCLQCFPASESFPMSQLFPSGGQSIGASASVLQWIFRVDLLQNGLVGSPCSPRDSQESSPTPQFKSLNSSVLSLLYGPTLKSRHDYKKIHSFDYIDLCWQSDVSAF